MTPIIFITGLPRTRTAWLANFFTGDGVLVYHDLLADCRKVEDIKFKLFETPAQILGDSDSGLPLFAKQLVHWYPEAKWLHVDRPLGAAIESYRVAFGDVAPYAGVPEFTDFALRESFDTLAAANEDLQSVVDPAFYHAVGFSKLNDRESMKAAWDFLLPGHVFPEHRWKLLRDMRINMIPGRRQNFFKPVDFGKPN